MEYEKSESNLRVGEVRKESEAKKSIKKSKGPEGGDGQEKERGRIRTSERGIPGEERKKYERLRGFELDSYRKHREGDV